MKVLNYFECGVCGRTHLTVDRALECERSHCKPVQIVENTERAKRYRIDPEYIRYEFCDKIVPTYPDELLVEMDNGTIVKYTFYGIERRLAHAGHSADAGGNPDSVSEQPDLAEKGEGDA